ncbi:hypothetical protein B7494_g8592 [Chlorociboria aeruginascens]|nr:hypothetical protein B7494_g8592 [Chlorociboria aeruginascens]
MAPQKTYLASLSLLKRDTKVDPSVGVTPPTSIPNTAIFVLFGIIGVGFVCTGIWFFFWAKNGGFYFTENDWDDYKSTVLRRKGPNGTTLSGATASTDLGGGSVVHGEGRSRWGRKHKKGTKSRGSYKDFDEAEKMSESAVTGLGSEVSQEMSEVKSKRGGRKKGRKEHRLRGGDLGDEEMDVGMEDDAVRAYRHEKPARVGGINKTSDASAFDGSTTRDDSTAASDLLSNREKTPTNTPTKMKKIRNDNYTGGSGGIRKVVSTSEGSSFWNRSSSSKKRDDATEDRIQAEAKKLQEKGRAARRDFSFQTGDDSTVSGADEREERRARREERRAKRIPGKYIAESEVGSEISGASSEIGTKSYHHPIPGLSSSSSAGDYAEEKRKNRNAGYRRDA